MHLFQKDRRLIAALTLCFCTFFSGRLIAEERVHEACINCHLSAAPNKSKANIGLLQPPLELCLGCHEDKNGNRDHAIGLEPKPDQTVKLPLVSGLISCTTCHDSHTKTDSFLRLPKEEFCLACHTI